MTRKFFILLLTVVIGCGQTVLPAVNQGKGPKPKDPPEPVQMGTRFYDSFARGTDTTKEATYPWKGPFNGDVVGYPTVTSPVRLADRSLDGTAGSNGVATYDYSVATSVGNTGYNITDLYLSFYIRISSAPSSNKDVLRIRGNTTNAQKAKIRIPVSTTQLDVLQEDNTSLGTSASLTTNVWYRVDLMIGTGTSGNYELRVHQDGSPGTGLELSGTGNFLTETTGPLEFLTSGTSTHYISHVVIEDGAYVANGNDYRVKTIFPNGNGTYTSWTGSYTDVDDVKADLTTTEITTSTNLNRETVTLEDISLSAGESVVSVMNVYHMRKTSNAVTDVQVIDRAGGTDRDSTSFDLAKNDGGDDDQKWFVIYDTKPGGGSWTESDVNGYEIGLEHNQAQAREIFCTAMNTNVLIEMPGAASAGKAGRMTLLGVQ